MMGGGARAAYQIGVLQGVAKFLPEGAASPFQVITGISAGAINALSLVAVADDFHKAVESMYSVWSNFKCDQIFYCDALGITKTWARWLLSMALANFGKNQPLSLLDRVPLQELLEDYLRFDGIEENIKKEIVHAVSVTASGYLSGHSMTFYQGHESINSWKRARRFGCREKLNISHLMASSAIPFIFSPVKVNREYFGDGSFRLVAPLSAPLHLGAEKIFVIGNRMEEGVYTRATQVNTPSFAEISAHILNSIFLDSLESDLERLNRINNTLDHISEESMQNENYPLRKVDTLMIAPSEDIGKMAEPFTQDMPRPLRLLLRGIGAMKKEGSTMVSYLMFEKGYCNELIALGYRDAISMEVEIRDFLNL